MFHKHLFGETGVGYNSALGQNRSTIAFYTGIGWGNSFTDNINSAGDRIFQKATYHRYFLQPSVSLDLKHVNFSLGLRFSNVVWQRFETESGLKDLSNSWFFEPVTEISAEMEDFDFVVQAGGNKPLDYEGLNFHYRLFHASVGIRYNLTRGKN